MDIIPFILLSAGIIAIPGPNVLVIVSTSIVHGRLRGLQTVAGTSAAMFIQLCVAALATHWIIAVLTHGFVWLKWAGVAYLIYLGVRQQFVAAKPGEQTISALDSLQRGFWVSLTNPKTILFFSAFLPQFVENSAGYLQQIVLLSAIFWLLAICLDSLYAIACSQLAVILRKQNVKSRRIAGVLYLGAGAALATAKEV